MSSIDSTDWVLFLEYRLIRNAVFQWKRWFLSGKTEIVTRKRGFFCRKQHFTSKIVLYSGKLRFYQEKLNSVGVRGSKREKILNKLELVSFELKFNVH